MELATVTLNAHTTSNSSMERPTPRNGKMIKAIMDLAALNSISGNPISKPTPTLPTLALSPATIDVKELSAETTPRETGKKVYATKTDVTSILSEMETRTSTGQAQTTQLIQPNPSKLSLNSSLVTTPITEISLKLRGSTFKTAKKSTIPKPMFQA